MELYFIVNPNARNGMSLKIWKKIERYLKSLPISYETLFTQYPGHAVELASKIAQSTENKNIIVAVGGDGTIHEVIRGIHQYDNIIVGYIPAGSGNDFSRGFSIPKKPLFALKQIIHLLEKRNFPKFDVGIFQNKEIKNGTFINNFGCGFDAVISRKSNQSKLKPILNRFSLGKLIYVYHLIKQIFIYQPTKLTVQIDGKERVFEKVWLVTVSNQPYIGGGMKIAPAAKSNDGSLDVVIVHNISRLKILFLFLTVFWGGHTKMKEVTVLSGKNIQIDSLHSLPLHADGEYAGNGSVSVSIKYQTLAIMTK